MDDINMSRTEEWMMGVLKFNDGVSFNTDGPMRVVHKKDGYYVVGEGMMCAVDSYKEGQKWIEQMEAQKEGRHSQR